MRKQQKRGNEDKRGRERHMFTEAGVKFQADAISIWEL